MRHLALPVAVALAGCGDEPVDVRGETVRLRTDEYRIVPQEVRVTGPRVRLVVRNDGRLAHNVKVEAEARDGERPARIVGGTTSGPPGATRTARLVLRPGTYRIACSLANHDDLGQYGTLEVTGRE